ncbi:hypothetical protein D4764_21G0004530 [Takifugu flavidus]|uniref:Uncharacterized protein n=1 Tax=Takifugu flavidus TaxID=433684 RepID=A0A5C6NEE9_9TELE|nr:hypothetical protein D4764_21G0004530 [Takifugu flavidus]
MSAGHATFPVFHHTDPSVVAGVVDEDPVPAHAVRGFFLPVQENLSSPSCCQLSLKPCLRATPAEAVIHHQVKAMRKVPHKPACYRGGARGLYLSAGPCYGGTKVEKHHPFVWDVCVIVDTTNPPVV